MLDQQDIVLLKEILNESLDTRFDQFEKTMDDKLDIRFAQFEKTMDDKLDIRFAQSENLVLGEMERIRVLTDQRIDQLQANLEELKPC